MNLDRAERWLMEDSIRRLKPDPENWPEWLREELRALAMYCAQLPDEQRRRAIRVLLSPRAKAYLAEQARRAFVAHRMLSKAESNH